MTRGAIERMVLQRPALKPDEAPLNVHYALAGAVCTLQARQVPILGVIGFGAARPAFLPESCPFIKAPLAPASGDGLFEIWSTASPCRPVRHGPVIGACNDDFAFGAVIINEADSTSLEAAVDATYTGIFDFLDEAGFAAPLRFWNYLTAITEYDNGLERYRRFNIGRHRAFSARLRQPVPPAATGIGGQGGHSVIYFLAAHEPAQTLENPRQIAAYAYPPVHGPCSPSFSRASRHRLGSLFISGTASITSHESRHVGDLNGQIAETIENLRALIGGRTLDERWALKVYLHDPTAQEMVHRALDAAFGPGGQRLYLCGDICRAELQLEIEAFCSIFRNLTRVAGAMAEPG